MPWIALDQPRTCGEYNAAQLRAAYSPGSAPHMRGIPPPHGGRHLCVRISPAHAGNTGGVARRYHMCGSAPHMRGIPATRRHRLRTRRISPAHAGNTQPLFLWMSSTPDQPRTCGEYILSATRPRVACGSAPHMRGIPRPERQAELFRRISPAHAGNTAYSVVATGAVRDQPRTCGEYVLLGFGGGHRVGISPAHAGNTRKVYGVDFTIWDQPRTCGEYLDRILGPDMNLGSAPHMRGIPAVGYCSRSGAGISPAHAGNTPPNRAGC